MYGKAMTGLSFHSAELNGPGYLSHTNRGATYLGELNRSSTHNAALAALVKGIE